MDGEREFVFGRIWHCHVLEKRLVRGLVNYINTMTKSQTKFACLKNLFLLLSWFTEQKQRIGGNSSSSLCPPNILLRHRILFLTVFCKCVMPELVGFSALQTWPRLELALASKLLNLLMLMQAGEKKRCFEH